MIKSFACHSFCSYGLCCEISKKFERNIDELLSWNKAITDSTKVFKTMCYTVFKVYIQSNNCLILCHGCNDQECHN